MFSFQLRKHHQKKNPIASTLYIMYCYTVNYTSTISAPISEEGKRTA